MLILATDLRDYYGVNPKTIVHVGAHDAEELNEYDIFEASRIYWIEAIPEKAENLAIRLDDEVNTVYSGVAWNTHLENIDFNISNQTMSSSVYNFQRHTDLFPSIEMIEKRVLKTLRLDRIIPNSSQIDLLNLDIQGSELMAIDGFSERLDEVKWIYTEISKSRLYDGGTTVAELDRYLTRLNFDRCTTRWIMGEGWGEALYCRNHKSHAKMDFKATNYFIAQVIYKTKLFLHQNLSKWIKH